MITRSVSEASLNITSLSVKNSDLDQQVDSLKSNIKNEQARIEQLNHQRTQENERFKELEQDILVK